MPKQVIQVINEKDFETISAYYDQNLRRAVEQLRKALSNDKRVREPVVEALKQIINDAELMLATLEKKS